MEKAILKRVITNLSAGDKIVVNYLTNKSELNGEYTVLGTKKGRGKGGSMLVELKHVVTNNNVILATKDSDSVLNVVVNNTMHGYATEADIPPVYEKNASKAVDLKRNFRALTKASVSNPIKVKIMSAQVQELNGVHEIVSAKQLRGRQGQIILTTKNGNEIWSYRHSGVIDSFEVLS